MDSDNAGGLNERERMEVDTMCELKTRRWADKMVRDVTPKMVERYIEAHNNDRAAHNATERKLDRIMWVLIGICGAGGTGAGMLIQNLLTVL